MKQDTIITLSALGILIIAGILLSMSSSPSTPKLSAKPELDGFTQCISDRGARFFGAFWCSHCQNQKKLFGSAAKLLPYTECSTPDGKGQLPVCGDRGVTGYPTWVFADGSTTSGEMSLDALSEKTGCLLPTTASTTKF
jgi:hypothetical protein